ncbi:PLDc N-terminal domain-containing protein [Flexivirga caeni]|nr:PLDc N-terminal domain-containing protein [Flexivirga caeni]
MFSVPWQLVLPVVVVAVALVLYCLVDIVRTDDELLLHKWQWTLAVVILVPLGAFAYLLVEKLGMVHSPGAPPGELDTRPDLYFDPRRR